MSAGNHPSKEPNHPGIGGTSLREKWVGNELLEKHCRPEIHGEGPAAETRGDLGRHETASKELGTFLRAKRAAIRPDDLGLQKFGPRRVPGLRREEVASVAGVGLTWYTWLEQGRDIRASRGMLQRVSRALRLSATDTAYLFSLAGQPAPEIRELAPGLESAVQAILDSYTAGPAFMMNEVFDAVAFNKLADVIYKITDYDGPWGRNMAWRPFMDPCRRQLHIPWPEYAAMMVGVFRARYAQRSRHPDLEKLLHQLLASSSDFEHFWNKSVTSGPSSYRPILVSVDFPGAGILNFESVRMMIATNPDWLVSFHSPIDSHTAVAMQRMNSEGNTSARSR